ncbi:pre-mRNA-splicing factor CWC22 homolog [Plodia interpunctella]|uniref:pre-mRNA-splicing factor CWC22 homolog n=1 Tax=Plodia interpunctella TaxID=58824 RepID=UPI0023684272|nr:pre-mRNA-splicing factor CWC22 homolog [Plodia interpunctella]
MENDRENKRRRDKNRNGDDDYRKERISKRARTRSRSPPPSREKDSSRKRRRSRSESQERPVKQEKSSNESQGNQKQADAPVRKAKETDMLNTRTGGAYIPPARLRMMQAQITDKSSVAYQRLAWEALKKSIHGHINKINVGNIGIIIKELLKENIVRGRGLLCRSVIQAQAASPTFTNVYAALVAAVNSRFPNIGELLLKRLVIQFKRGFKRNDKPTCISSASFIAHLVNQRVAHEILALELLTLLVETPTDDSVEVSIAFLKECGQKLTEVSSKGVNAIFEMLRNILHEGQLDKRVQYMIEVMFQVWKDGFKDHPALIEELELVPEEEQFTHLLMLDDATDPQDILNVFKFDEKYEENEQKYKTLSKEILGSDAESGEEDGSYASGSEESDDEEAEGEQKPVTIIDNTETNLVALRRTIYLTINSSLDFEECAHKLMKMELKPGQEVELCHMFLDCCAEQRTYEKFYGLLAQRFCNINRIYIGPFEEIFKDSYSTAHRLDTNRLRNVSKFFAHLLFTDSISWEVLDCVKLNEEDTTSSSRIYIKILFQELAEYMGLKKLNDRLQDPTLQSAFSGIFPRDNPKNTRFSINFFTSIGLGGLTDELREHLKQMPKNVPAPITEITLGSDSSSSSSSSSSDSSSDSSSSDSEEDKSKKKSKKKSDKKNKSASPKTPAEEVANKNNDRWGHDGFYDTYGKDARRTENRPDRRERDDDNFVRPRDVRNDNRDRFRERNCDESRRRPDGRARADDFWGNAREERNDRQNREGGSRDRSSNEERYRNREDDNSRSSRNREDRSRRDGEEPRRRNRDESDTGYGDSESDRGTRHRKGDDSGRETDDPRNNRESRDHRRDKDRRQDSRTERDDESDRHNLTSSNRKDRNYEKDSRIEDDSRRKKSKKDKQVDSSSDEEDKRDRGREKRRKEDRDDSRRKHRDSVDDSRKGDREDRRKDNKSEDVSRKDDRENKRKDKSCDSDDDLKSSHKENRNKDRKDKNKKDSEFDTNTRKKVDKDTRKESRSRRERDSQRDSSSQREQLGRYWDIEPLKG